MLLEYSPQSFGAYSVSAASVIFIKDIVIRKIVSNFIICHFEVVNLIFKCNKFPEPVHSSICAVLTTDLLADSTLIHSPV